MTLPTMTRTDLAAHIQHTRIEPAMTSGDIRTHCEEAIQHGFNAVMVPGSWVGLAVDVLRGTDVLIASAVDFPIVGSMSTRGKIAEAVSLVADGAQQLDIGVGIGWLRSGQHDRYRADIAAVVEGCGVPVKVMLELPLLHPHERDLAVGLAVEAGVAYVKNASGGAVGNAQPEDIAYLRSRVPAHVGVKASGGIKTLEIALALLASGADLLGTSAGIQLLDGGDGAADPGY